MGDIIAGMAGNIQSTNDERSMSELLSSSRFAGIMRKAQELKKLDALLQTALEPELRVHCRVANYRDQELILQADTSALATRVRYAATQLKKTLKTFHEFNELKKIKCHVKL